jgi:hypothetical protein
LNPYLEINFAGDFKKIKTPHLEDKTNPVFDLSSNFNYSTKYANALDKKKITFTVMSHVSFGVDDVIGTAQVDLHTVASGPFKHNLPLFDVRSLVCECVRMYVCFFECVCVCVCVCVS